MLGSTALALLGSIYAIFRKTLNKFFTDNFKASTKKLNQSVDALNQTVMILQKMLDHDFKELEGHEKQLVDHEKRIHTLEDWKEFHKGN